MERTGGLKLTVMGATRADRRPRFAAVLLSTAGGADDRRLVTDSDGRMRCRLPDGEYRLSVGSGEPEQFSVRDRRWTTVRVHLV